MVTAGEEEIMKYRHQGKDNQRRALLKSLVLGVIKHGGIETSRSQGKNAQRFLERLVHIAKKDSINSRRRVFSLLTTNREVVSDFFEIAENFKDRVSGYTRIIRLGKRRGDATDMVRLEWVEDVEKSTRSTKGTTSTKGKKDKMEETQQVASI